MNWKWRRDQELSISSPIYCELSILPSLHTLIVGVCLKCFSEFSNMWGSFAFSIDLSKKDQILDIVQGW